LKAFDRVVAGLSLYLLDHNVETMVLLLTLPSVYIATNCVAYLKFQIRARDIEKILPQTKY